MGNVPFGEYRFIPEEIAEYHSAEIEQYNAAVAAIRKQRAEFVPSEAFRIAAINFFIGVVANFPEVVDMDMSTLFKPE